MRAMLFAAGLGTRLRPLTLERPKPGVPLANRPMAWFALSVLHRAGIRRVVVNTHYLGESLPGLLEGHVPAGMELSFVHEPELLGTGGGLKNVQGQLVDGDEPIVVINADIVFDPDLSAALATHRRLDALATMILRPDPDAQRYGALDIDAEGRVRRLLGTPEWDGPLDTYMFTGVHILSPRALDDLPDSGCIVRDGYRQWIDRGDVIAGHVEERSWRDVGTLGAYLQTNLDLRRGTLAFTGIEASDFVGGPDAVVSPKATIATGANLDEVVVWDGARVDSSLRRCVVTPEVTVEIPEPSG